ncbi:MAG TPA: hypothetical protein VL574_08860 [Stellaceae bacterium]|nr:hypothetical protein [Stellaceae bacterium]
MVTDTEAERLMAAELANSALIAVLLETLADAEDRPAEAVQRFRTKALEKIAVSRYSTSRIVDEVAIKQRATKYLNKVFRLIAEETKAPVKA